MAIGASILRSEIRRHLLMNFSLVASCVVGATVVTNERGLFVPINAEVSDSARAFAAMFTQSRLLPEQISNVQMVTPLAPFEVTADSRDLRRRLMDALATSNDPSGAGGVPQEFQQNSAQMPTLDNQVLSLNGPGSGGVPAGGVAGGSGGGAGGGSGGGSGGSQGSNSTTVASATSPTGSTGNTGSGTSAGNTQPITVASASNPAQSQSSSGVTDGSAIGDGGISLGNSSGTDITGPAAVPEPSIWAMLIAGFGMIGYLMRTGRKREEQTEADAAA